MALKDLIIEVQGTLLHQLAEAEQDDNFTDFTSTIQTAVRTRRKAINVLNDLYIRVEEKDQKEKEEEEKQKEKEKEKEKEHSKEAQAPTLELKKNEEPVKVEEETKDRSRLKFWSRRSSNEPPKQRESREVLTPVATPPSPNLVRQGTYTPSDISRQSTYAPSTTTRHSTWSAVSPHLSPQHINPLTRINDFGGFCKGAWHAQNLNLTKAVDKPSLRSYGWSFHCTKCKYTLQADVRDRNLPRFDDRVYKTEDMRFRLLFLLKSHLPQKSSKDLRTYGCLPCALAGAGLKKCTGENHLLAHVQNHALQTFGETVLAGPVSFWAESVLAESMSTYDVIFDGGEDFALPPSALTLTQSQEPGPLNLAEEMFGLVNVWADEKSVKADRS
jgi:hypothetical protein